MNLGKTLGCAAILVGALGVTGCGISPGDYVIYRVTPGTTDQNAGCYYPDTEPAPNVESDSSTVRATGTWFIYASINDAFYLDDGQNTLEGVATDTGYQFTGKTVNVQYDIPDGTGSKRTVTDSFTVSIVTDGDAISGSNVAKTTYGCAGTTCGDKIPSCTKTTDFVGTHVDEIQLNHDL
jgi:hypothetical protein